jgi:hypothetical protein
MGGDGTVEDGAAERAATRKLMADMLVELTSNLSVVTSATLRQMLQMLADLLLDSSEVDCTFRSQLFGMVRAVVDTLAANPNLEVPMDTMTATVRGLNGMLVSLSNDMTIVVNISDAEDFGENATDATNATSAPTPAEGGVRATVKTTGVSISGAACPMGLIDEARGLSAAMSSAINQATLKAISKAVAGEAPLSVSAGGLSLVGKRGTDFAGTLDVGGGASFELPAEVNPSGGAALDIVAIVSDRNANTFSEFNQTGNQTGKVGIGGSVSLSFSQNGAARPVKGLVTPIMITIPHPPMDNETFIECRYWDPETESMLTDGCELFASFENHSVCACTHLTDFSMGTLSKFADLFDNIQNTDIMDLIPQIEPLTAEDWENLTFENILKCGEAAGALLCFYLLYLAFLPFVCYMDRFRTKHFRKNYVAEIDESFDMYELGSRTLSFEDLLSATDAKVKFDLKHNNVHQFSSCRARMNAWGFFCCICCNARKKPFLTVLTEEGEGEGEGLIAVTFGVGNLIRTDVATMSDPVACVLLFDKETNDFLPYARTEMVIDSQDHNYKRRIILKMPKDRTTRIMVVVTDDDHHEGLVEYVDPVTNEIFMTAKTVPKAKLIQMKRELYNQAENEHDWVALTSLKLDPFTAVQRLTTLLCVFVTETAIVAFMFGDPNEESDTPALLLDLAVAVWTALILIPVTIPFAMLFRKSGKTLITLLYHPCTTLVTPL